VVALNQTLIQREGLSILSASGTNLKLGLVIDCSTRIYEVEGR